MYKFNKLLLFSLYLQLALGANSAVSQEINMQSLGDEIAWRENGCSNETIKYLNEGKSSVDGVEITEALHDALLLNDIFLAACIRFKQPENSLELIQSVRSRLDDLSETRSDFSNVEYSNKKHITAYYLVYWYLPYFTNGLESEAIDQYKQDYQYFKSLKDRDQLGSYEFVYSQFLFTDLFKEKKDLSFIISSQQELEDEISRATEPENIELNTKLADLLKQVRLRRVYLSSRYGDYDQLAADLTLFNSIYLSNYQDGKILSNEFAMDVAETLEYPIDLVYEILPPIEIIFSNQELHTLSYQILDLPSDFDFPVLGQLQKNFFLILQDRITENDTLQHLITFLADFDGTPQNIFSSYFFNISIDFNRQENCEGIFNSLNPIERYQLIESNELIDYFYNILFLEIKSYCQPSLQNYWNEVILYRQFLEQFGGQIIGTDLNIFSDRFLSLEHALIERIYSGIQNSMTKQLPEYDENYRDLITEEVKLLDQIFYLQDESVLMAGQEFLEEQELAQDALEMSLIINKRLDELGFSVQLEHQLTIEAYASNNIWDYMNLNTEFILNYAELINKTELIEFIDKYIDKIDMSFWIYIRDENEKQIVEKFFDENIFVTESLVKIFFNKIISDAPLFEPRFDQIYHRSSSNLLALYVNLLYFKNFILDDFDQKKYLRLSRELADLSLKIRSNDLSRLVLMQQVVRTIEDEKYKGTLTDYLEIIRYIDSINENKIIFKNSETESLRHIDALEVELKKTNKELKDDLLNFGILDNQLHSNFYAVDSDLILSNLKSDEAMISFVVDYDPRIDRPQFIYVFTYVNGEVYLSSVNNVTKEVVKDYMNNFTPESAIKNHFDLSLSKELYENLLDISPFGNHIWALDEAKNIKKIFIVADQFLQGFPFHTLFNDKEGRWLAEEVDIRYLPDEASYLLLKEQDVNYSDQLFVGIGNPALAGTSNKTLFENLFDLRGNTNKNKLRQLTSLPSTKKELESLAKRFKNKKLFLGRDANESILSKNILNDASIISFATHAVEGISNNSYEVGLVLTPPIDDLADDDGLLTKSEISSLKLNNPTVILSACNTSRGLYKGANRYSGLTAGFFEAGANALITSSWDLETNSARVMSSLAMEIATKESIPIGSAYNRAIREFINNPKYEQYSHPFYWAGFQTMGK